ncbi:unnamed protein product [Brassicogethes aeneus]|uniref:Dynein intermediate chain 3, ciliary n=1 Tax=Brassicogethes aeneus TaxID=1431903 RepID=A0A9P0AP95_BRAAE|nr:unnamed protein product [Brassicogethes aeneus]
MDIQFSYQKKRAEFGRQCLFSDKGPDLIDNYPSNRQLGKQYILKDPFDRHQQCAPIFAEHDINTTRAEYTTASMNHIEGGWPKDINLADEEQPKRYRRKIEKEENYFHTMMALFKNVENCILQNNSVNIYQQYFSDVEPTPLIERSSARTLNVYQDQYTPTRPVTHISWSPDGQTKLAVSYANLLFQAEVPNELKHSFIWDVENPNRPLMVLKPDHSAVCMEYHQKDPNTLVSGHKNGVVSLWDIRKGLEPVDSTIVEMSFRDPVYSVLWMNSKSGCEFFSGSTDGTVKWWDTRNLSEPTDTLILDYAREEDQDLAKAYGCSCLEYEPTIPTRFSVGTEQGVTISCNRKGKSAVEKMSARFQAHLGPVWTMQRNPGFVKNFLTIGDWTAKVWSEDCKESAIIWTNYHMARLTDGAWSPTRFSVFFTTRSDGVLDVWDLLQQQDEAVLSVKICDEELKTLRPHDSGRMVAVGNQKGTTYLVQFSENISMNNKNDKALLTAMFERENRREKILEARFRELRLKQKKSEMRMDASEAQLAEDPSEFVDKYVTQAEAEFKMIIDRETKPPEEEEEEEEEEEDEFEDEPEPPPPPPPPPESEEKKEKKDKKGKKGKKKK